MPLYTEICGAAGRAVPVLLGVVAVPPALLEAGAAGSCSLSMAQSWAPWGCGGQAGAAGRWGTVMVVLCMWGTHGVVSLGVMVLPWGLKDGGKGWLERGMLEGRER